MEFKEIIAYISLCLLMYPSVYSSAEIGQSTKDKDLTSKSTMTNGSSNVVESISGGMHLTGAEDTRKTAIETEVGDYNSMQCTPLIPMPETDYKDKIEVAASKYISKSLYPISDSIIPDELSSRVKSVNQLVGLLSSPKPLSSLSPAEMHAVVSLLAAGPSTGLPASAIVNVISALSTSPALLAKLSRPAYFSLLTLFTARPHLLSSLPTPLLVQFAAALFSSSLLPGTLYAMPTPVLVSLLGPLCTPAVLDALSTAQMANLATVLSLSEAAVKSLPVAGLVSLVEFLGSKPDVLGELPPATMFRLLRSLFDALSDSAPYLLNGSTSAAVARLLAALLTPAVLNIMPLDAFSSLLAVLHARPSLLLALPASSVVSLLSIVVSSPNLLVSTDPGHLDSLLATIASEPGLLDSMPAQLIADLVNALIAYLPDRVVSMPKSTLASLLQVVQQRHP